MDRARLVENGVTIGLGVGLLLYAHFVLGNKPGASPKRDERTAMHRRYGKFWGLVFIGLGVGRLIWTWPAVNTEMPDPDSFDWQTVKTTDGILSVRMPGKAELYNRQYQSELGPTKHVRQVVAIHSDKIVFSVSEKHYLDEELQFEVDDYLDALVPATIAQTGGKSTGATRIQRGALRGRELKIEWPNGHTVATELFLTGRSLYQLNVATPNELAATPMVRTFFESLVVMSPVAK